MRRLLAAVAALSCLALGLPQTAFADPPGYAQVVSSCNSQVARPQVGANAPFTIDQFGNHCTYDSQTDADVAGFWHSQPALGQAPRANSIPVTLPTDGGQATASAKIDVSTATTTKIISASGSTVTYISAFDFQAPTTQTVTPEYGTGSNCGTGTTTLTGAYTIGANGGGLSKGSGTAAFWFIPANNDFCILTTQAVQVSGSASYAQF